MLSLSWGVISDIDIESEVFRWMGGARFTVQALVRVMAPRVYSGKVSYLPASAQDPPPSAPRGGPPSPASLTVRAVSPLLCLITAVVPSRWLIVPYFGLFSSPYFSSLQSPLVPRSDRSSAGSSSGQDAAAASGSEGNPGGEWRTIEVSGWLPPPPSFLLTLPLPHSDLTIPQETERPCPCPRPRHSLNLRGDEKRATSCSCGP